MIDTIPLCDDTDRIEQNLTIDSDEDLSAPDPVSNRWDADLADRIDQSIPVPVTDDY